MFDTYPRFPGQQCSTKFKMLQGELTHSQTCWCLGSLGSVSDQEPPPHPTQGEEGWIPYTQNTRWEGEMTDLILALAAFGGTYHFFTTDHSSVGKNLAFFMSDGN